MKGPAPATSAAWSTSAAAPCRLQPTTVVLRATLASLWAALRPELVDWAYSNVCASPVRAAAGSRLPSAAESCRARTPAPFSQRPNGTVTQRLTRRSSCMIYRTVLSEVIEFNQGKRDKVVFRDGMWKFRRYFVPGKVMAQE
eukprot:scaffold3311_cov411-Prasinococcus_capsulatus_cf.AAC.1